MLEILRARVSDRSAWTRADMERDRSWLFHLPDAAVADMNKAVEQIKRRGFDLTRIRKEDFPLPSIAADLADMIDEIENGRGFVVLRGVPVEHYSLDEASIAAWGISAHLGTAISQNMRGERLCSVTDLGGTYGVNNVRGYTTSERLDFHTDNSDIVGLLFLKQAKSGGTSLLTSSTSIHNEIVAHCPQHLDVLHRGFIYDLRGEQRPGLPPHSGHRIPVYSYFAGKLSCRYVRMPIERGAILAGQSLQPNEIEALDALDRIAQRPDLCLPTDFAPGDLQFVNNHTTLHARTAYVDHDEPELRRHLLRIWINISQGRPLASEFANRYGPDCGRLGVPPVAVAARS